MTAEHLVSSQKDHSITLIGPVLPEPSWQAKTPNGFDVSTFAIDWDNKSATCPQGHASTSWTEGQNAHGHDIVRVSFGRKTCLECPTRSHCTKSVSGPRTLTIKAKLRHEALRQARQREKTEEFKKAYQARAGVEGTISQAVRVTDVRRSRYVGRAKTHLQHLVAAAALNILRVGAWLLQSPRARTRRSAFAALAPNAA